MSDLPVVEEVPVEETPVEAIEKEAIPFNIPNEAVELSTGVYVYFRKLPKSISTELTIKTFSNINLDKKGNIVTDNMNTKDQITMAKSVSEYHNILIQEGVSLVGPLSYYIKKLDLPNNWLKKLLRSNLVERDMYDLSDEEDIEYLFLRYYGFISDDDFSLLSQRTLNQ